MLARTAFVVALGLAGCAQPQQYAQIPYSPTGCYVMHRGLLTSAILGRYEPAPCNVTIEPAVSTVAYEAPPALPPIGIGLSAAQPQPIGVWSGAGPGWAGAGTGVP